MSRTSSLATLFTMSHPIRLALGRRRARRRCYGVFAPASQHVGRGRTECLWLLLPVRYRCPPHTQLPVASLQIVDFSPSMRGPKWRDSQGLSLGRCILVGRPRGAFVMALMGLPNLLRIGKGKQATLRMTNFLTPIGESWQNGRLRGSASEESTPFRQLRPRGPRFGPLALACK